MFLLFAITVAGWPPVWERAVRSICCACLSCAFVNFRVCPSFPFGVEVGMWDVIILIPDHCLSIYFGCSSAFCHNTYWPCGKLKLISMTLSNTCKTPQ